jgi:hypothetical protein
MSKQRLRAKLAEAEAEIVRLKIAIAALGPVVVAAEELRGACDWHDRATCEAEADRACEALDTAIDAVCAAVGARRAGEPAPAADIPDGWVMDAPAQTPAEVAAFLADYEWPGEAAPCTPQP